MSIYKQFVILLLLNLAFSKAQINQTGSTNEKDKRQPARFNDAYDRNTVSIGGMKDYTDYNNYGQQYAIADPFNNPTYPYNPHQSEADHWKQSYVGNTHPYATQNKFGYEKPSFNDGSYHDYQNQQLKYNNSPHYNQYTSPQHNVPNQGPYAYPYGHNTYNPAYPLPNKSGQTTYPAYKQPGYSQQTNVGLSHQRRHGFDTAGYTSKQTNYAHSAFGYQQQPNYQQQSNYGYQQRQQPFPQQNAFGYPQQNAYGYNQK